MDNYKLRDKYWDEFTSFIQNRPRKPLSKDLTKERFTGNKAIQVFDRDDLRLMLGINNDYARCSLHITWDNLNDHYSRLKPMENDLIREFQLKRQPDFIIKRNPKTGGRAVLGFIFSTFTRIGPLVRWTWSFSRQDTL